jgi:hypothetical protein
MHECIHICDDIDSGQNVKKKLKHFLQYKNEAFYHIFSKNEKYNFLASEVLVNNRVKFATPFICFKI